LFVSKESPAREGEQRGHKTGDFAEGESTRLKQYSFGENQT
jgi:hypothetical protein